MSNGIAPHGDQRDDDGIQVPITDDHLLRMDGAIEALKQKAMEAAESNQDGIAEASFLAEAHNAIEAVLASVVDYAGAVKSNVPEANTPSKRNMFKNQLLTQLGAGGDLSGAFGEAVKLFHVFTG